MIHSNTIIDKLIRSIAIITLVLTSGILQANTLFVFIDKGAEIDQQFEQNYLPDIKLLAEKYHLKMEVVNVQEGAPEEITITPQLVFQNENGRSYYVGRYSELSRLANFIRTVRNNPQEEVENIKREILSFKEGKSVTVLPIKITRISGEISQDEALDFAKTAKNQIVNGFKKFRVEQEVFFQRTNRAFYLDIHPFLDVNKKLYLSYEIYSQFNCVVPVLSRLNNPISGNWDQREKLLEQLGKSFENEVFDLIGNDIKGDGYTSVSMQIPAKKWLVSDNVSSKTIVNKTLMDLPKSWQVSGPLDPQTPLIQFNFFAPLDSYSGEVKKIQGTIEWDESGQLAGSFKVDTKEVTMGEETYDKNVHKKYLKVFRFPMASFEFSDATVSLKKISQGVSDVFLIEGNFTLMKKSYPVVVKASFETFIGENNEPILLVTARFDLDIFKKFGINGPDGPEYAQQNMHFNMQFLMNSNSK